MIIDIYNDIDHNIILPIKQYNVERETQLYKYILNNIEKIKKIYFELLDPTRNNLTQKYLNNGLNYNEALSLSFFTIISMQLQLIS